LARAVQVLSKTPSDLAGLAAAKDQAAALQGETKGERKFALGANDGQCARA
jgi:hypothetical protein